jgi:ethanolamine-phosphate cytidylyltransferase
MALRVSKDFADELELTSAQLELQDSISMACDRAAVLHPSLPGDSIKRALSNATAHVLAHYTHRIDADAVAEANLAKGHESSKKKPVRVYIDGCFDIMHAGHFNALRQAKALGDILVVGVHSDEEIMRNKGPPVMQDEERKAVVAACKWVDEVAFGTPYVPSVELLDQLNCDFVVHGDDMATSPDGVDVYEEVKKAGRMRIVKRSTGISTTDLVGRLLLLTKDHHVKTGSLTEAKEPPRSSFLTTSWRLSEFANRRRPKPNDVIIYVDGVFDLFHIGHIRMLEEIKKLGTFLFVGIHDDKALN